MFVTILLKSLIIGALAGAAVAAGAARMFHAPRLQAMGAFRTLGELNACQGDPTSHFTFGLGFFFTSSVTNVASGALTQDVLHRIIPNWAAGVLLTRNRDLESTVYDPSAMAWAGALVGAAVVAFMNTAAALVPASMANIGSKVLVPAGNLLINPVMPAIFWLAAMDGGREAGVAATLVGGMSHMIIGNAVPGLVLGILIGKNVEENGWNKATIGMVAVVLAMFAVIGYFRGFHLKLLSLF